jgi:hypothetical protein
MLIPLLGDIEKEIKNKLFLDEFKLTRKVKKIILASREYYDKNPWKPFKNGDILFCYFYGKQNVDNIVEKATGETIVSLSIHNKPKKEHIMSNNDFKNRVQAVFECRDNWIGLIE